jgi:hypothetical protein
VQKHFEDELEILMLTNPRGGKPQQMGRTYWIGMQTGCQSPEDVVEISAIREDSSKRFHLGYCKCGMKISAGEKRALVLIKTMQKILGIATEEQLDAKILSGMMQNAGRG